MKNQIKFRNPIQKALYENEYTGQFSDGRWENSTVHNWRLWCNAEVSVSEEVGTTIPNYEIRYNLEDLDLLKVVGYRMLGLARIINAFPSIEVSSSLEYLVDRFIMTDMDDKNKDYRKVQVKSVETVIAEVKAIKSESYKAEWLKRLALVEKTYSLEVIYEALRSDDYLISDMMKDVRDMKVILNTMLEK